MLCFIIALMNKSVASDWDIVERNFNNTLRSIFNQTDANFRVYVGYTDMPRLYDEYDNRLNMIQCNTHTPIERVEKTRDRAWKLSVCSNAIYQNIDNLAFEDGGVFVFPVDADDLVNRNIAKYVNTHSTANGFKSKKSYMHKKGRHYLEITPWFGGTMNIMKLYKTDIVPEIPDVSKCFDLDVSIELRKYPVTWDDFAVEQKFAEMGRAFSRLPFKSTIYNLGTGDNLSDSDPQNQKIDGDRFHPIAFLRKISLFNKSLITKNIKIDFGIGKEGFNF